MTSPCSRNQFQPSATRRSSLMMSCAAGAIAMVALHPTSATAQDGAFRGTVSSTTGSVVRLTTSDTTETITVNSNTAVINWAPTDVEGFGNVDFLPEGNVATFVNGASISDYTVLNRIIPVSAGRAVELNGTVISQIQEGSAIGGHVWFYAPGGLVIGSKAVFDVGGLLLSAADPISFSASSTGFTGSFAAASESLAQVVVRPGAQINATPENSYVAIIAPHVVQQGTITVNGSAALVGAEAATMILDQGLFDIAVTVGTSSFSGVSHTGTTTGPASSAAADVQKIYMVAVPKNQALTMILGGTAGFAPAVSADVENGAIVLSAGHSIDDSTDGLVSSFVPGTNAGLMIDGGNFTSDVRALANGLINAFASSSALTFAGDLSLQSFSAATDGDIWLWTPGQALTIGGDLYAQTQGATYTSGIEIDAWGGGVVDIAGKATLHAGPASDGTPGWVGLYADSGGSIAIDGATLMTARAEAAPPVSEGDSADSYGGDISIDAYGGSITLGTVFADVSANGQDNIGNGSGIGGAAYGGSISVSAASEGSVTVNGDFTATAHGYGGNMLDGATGGGLGEGGWIDIESHDGTIAVTGGLNANANGFGGDYLGEGVPETALGGIGSGGDVLLYSGGAGGITVGGLTNLFARGLGGDGQTGGAANGGWAGIEAFDGTIALDAIEIAAGAVGGKASSGFGGTGGGASGGTAFIEAFSYEGDEEVPASTGTVTGGDTNLYATGTGGTGGASNGDSIEAGSGGDGQGGNISVLADGELTLGTLVGYANGVGGVGGAGGSLAGGAGGNGYGGDAYLSADGSFGAAEYVGYARAFGGAGGTGATQGAGGEAEAGYSYFFVGGSGTAEVTGTTYVNASAFGGDGSTGGAAFGGYSDLAVEGALSGFGVQVTAQGFGGEGTNGAGGEAWGGESYVDMYGGTLTMSNHLSLLNEAEGGGGTTVGGAAHGGVSNMYVNAGSIVDLGDNAHLTSSANGGLGPIDGMSEAGATVLRMEDSSVTGGALLLTSSADNGGYVSLDLAGSGLSATSVTLNSNGTMQGGTVFTNVGPGYEFSSSSLSTGTFTATALGTSSSGAIYVNVATGSTADLGAAQITVAGDPLYGGIFVLVGGEVGDELDGFELAATAAAPLTAQSLTINGDGTIQLLSQNGAGIDVAGDVSILGEQILLWHDGVGATLTAGDIDLTANLILADMGLAAATVTMDAADAISVGDIEASDFVDLHAGGMLQINGLVSAPEITVTSQDIEIYGQLGDHGVTDFITFNAMSSGAPVIIGGGEEEFAAALEGYQYRLSGGEEVEGDHIAFNALGIGDGPAPDVYLEGLEIDGSDAEEGGTSHVELHTGGSVFVNAPVVMFDAAPTDKIEIHAGRSIEVDTSIGGLIALIDGSERPTGVLELVAQHIWVGNSSLLSNLREDLEFDGRDDALNNNPGEENPDGFLVARRIELSIEESLFVQNSGSDDDLAGITVGEGGLEIDAIGEGDAAVIAFGRRLHSDGDVTGGVDFAGEVEFGDVSEYTEASRFNGCALTGDCGDGGPGPGPGPDEPLPPTVSGPEAILGPVGLMESPTSAAAPEDAAVEAMAEEFAQEEAQKLAEAEDADEEDEDSEKSGSADVSLGLISTGSLTLDQLIEEPVTSGGDTIQWDPVSGSGEEQ